MTKIGLVSVIVPVYNVEKYLNRCVESIRNQTYSDLEIILVDDGSPDKSGEICEEFKKSDNRIKVVHKENGGLGFARNSGLKVATGRFVTFVDSDDWIAPDHISNMCQAISNAQADICIGGNTNINAVGKTMVKTVKLNPGIYKGNDVVEQILLPLIGPDTDFHNDIQLESSCCMNLYDMNIIRDFNLQFISEKYAVAEDIYFNIDYLYHTNAAIVTTEVGYFYFENAESISRKYNPERFARTINFYKEVNARVEKYGLVDKISYRLDRSYLTKIRVAIRHIVDSNLKFDQKINQIKIITSHQLTKTILKRYPVDTFAPPIQVFVRLMKLNCPVGVYCVMALREFAQKNDWTKRMLKTIGIER